MRHCIPPPCTSHVAPKMEATKPSQIVLLNGATFFTNIPLEDLLVLWKYVKQEIAIIRLLVETVDGIPVGLDIRKLDEDRTFGDAIIVGYPSLPPQETIEPYTNGSLLDMEK